MQLSVIIVNYNVKYFLEQCLLSVLRACDGLSVEVIVVDNASSDGSVDMVKQKFPNVKLIANADNTGFSKANNQGIKTASGEYILLLNPDTVVAEDTFSECVLFMNNHPEAGALGVRMIDGKGNFLPESKRGLPTPAVAFYKTFGLSFLFPQSKTFGKYHLGFLPENETNEVDILSGAFMFIRKAALDKAGLLDETFFMYGEDVDLSYRIQQAGYKNYYFADTTIIHYKGESTRKGSLNYVRVFYKAMIIFAEKHFSGNQSSLFSLCINFAIVLRGMLTLLSGMLASSYLFVLDALLSFTGIYFIKSYWESMIKYSEDYYPDRFLFIVVPAYILFWITASFFSGSYDRPYKISKIFRGILLGTIGIAVLYAFIPDEWRFSRAMILLGAMWTGFEMIVTRTFYHLVAHQSFSSENSDHQHTLIAGNTEAQRAEATLRNLGYSHEVSVTGKLNEVPKLAALQQCNEVIFCSADFGFGSIIETIQTCGRQFDYKILNPGSEALIGSNSKNSAGDLYVAERSYALFKPENLRSKRLFDVCMSLLLIITLPLQVLLVKNPGGLIRNILAVMSGKKWWVGFKTGKNVSGFSQALVGVLHPAVALSAFNLNEQEEEMAELTYARHYSLRADIRILLNNYRLLGS